MPWSLPILYRSKSLSSSAQICIVLNLHKLCKGNLVVILGNGCWDPDLHLVFG